MRSIKNFKLTTQKLTLLKIKIGGSWPLPTPSMFHLWLCVYVGRDRFTYKWLARWRWRNDGGNGSDCRGNGGGELYEANSIRTQPDQHVAW